MSAALQRLAGRATGALTGGLRPRLPSRFETGIREPGLQEIHAGVPGPAAPTPGPVPAAQADERTSRRATAIAEPSPARPRSPAAAPDAAGPQLAARLASEIPAGPERRATIVAEPARTAAPAPLLRETTVLREAPPAPMVADAVAGGEVPAPARAPVPPRAAPEPLLAPAPVPHMPEARPVAPSGRPSGRAALEPAAEQSPPEITIQIGRIDIREPARQAATRQRTVQPQPLPALSDYLRGGRS